MTSRLERQQETSSLASKMKWDRAVKNGGNTKHWPCLITKLKCSKYAALAGCNICRVLYE